MLASRGDVHNDRQPEIHSVFMFLRSILTTIIFPVFALITGASAAEWAFVPPKDAGVVNVKDFGAKGDGVTDDTAAIAAAINANIDKSRYRANPFIWFPKGTYLVSGPFESRNQLPGYDTGKVWSAGWRSMLILIGESRSGSVIKLADGAPGYGDPAKPKWIIGTGSESDKKDNYAGGGNRAFRHGILNLTVDAGSGNPGAIGIDFIANNRGSIDGVTIRAGANSGHTGIAMTRPWPGPAMVMDVRIEGFAQGMALSHFQYGMTFENVQMSGQREVGIVNSDNVLAMRRVEFVGKVPFYVAKGGHSMLCLLDSTIKGTGTESLPAIRTPGFLNLRRVTVEGYAQAVDDTSKENRDVPAGLVKSHDQGFTLSATAAPPAPLDLAIEEIPTVRPPAGAVWTDGGSTRESLQAAIDSGAEWIYLKPVQTVKLDDTVILRGKTRLIMGMHGCVEAPAGKRAFRVENGSAPVVAIEHLFVGGGIEQASDRTLLLCHADVEQWGIHATGAGKTHVVDVIGRNYQIGPQHRFWARQLNAEFGPDALFTNAGTSWILGFKMESSTGGSKDAPQGTPSAVNKAGQLELFGGLLYTLGNRKEHAPTVPAFTNERGKIAVSYRTNGIPDTYYKSVLRMGTLTEGTDLTREQIKGPGAALLTDQR
jgi:hypothetical protein